MKTSQSNWNPIRAFTLIELLVVIAIIAILAGLLLTAGAGIKNTMIKKRAKAELQQVALAIDTYKLKLGYFPPDNRNNYARNALYYELAGCERTASGVQTLDRSISISSGQLNSYLGAVGVMNSSAGSSSDEGTTSQSFLKDIKFGQYGERILPGSTPKETVRVLGVSLDGPVSWPPAPQQANDIEINPFRYNSSNPTNNPTSYDLWVDIVVGGKTNRISNWSSGPQQL